MLKEKSMPKRRTRPLGRTCPDGAWAHVAVIQAGDAHDVLYQVKATREWEGYRENVASICQALERINCRATLLADGIQLPARLQACRPDVAWICSGGIQGRDQAAHLPGLLEMLGLPYVGASPLSAALSDNKIRAKQIAVWAGVPTPEFFVLDPSIPPEGTMHDWPPFPLMLKPATGMCGCGIIKACNPQRVLDGVARIRGRYADTILMEAFVQGEDVTVPVLEMRDGIRILPPVRRHFPESFAEQLSFTAVEEHAIEPAAMTPEMKQSLASCSESLFRKIGLRHAARLDFRVADHAFHFLEMNHKPDLRPAGCFAQSAQAAGMEYDNLIRHLLFLALNGNPATD